MAGQSDTTGARREPLVGASAPPTGNGSRVPFSPPTGRDEEESRVGPLLARANLLRLRGQWDEAVAVCTEALRKAPESPTAHSLLGDIYEAQGKLDDALQWFGMAVDLDPANKADRAKLDRVVQAQRRALLSEEKGAGGRAAAGGPASAADPGNRTLEWFDRIFPPGKSESVARIIWLLSGVVALILLLAVAFVLLEGGNNNAQNAPAPIFSPATPAPVVVRPDPGAPPPPPLTPQAPPAPRPPDSPAPGSTAPPAVPDAGGSGDATLLEAVRRAMPPETVVTDAQVDPRSAHVLLVLIVPAAAPVGDAAAEAPGAVRERVLRGAVQAARAAALASPALERASVRVSLRAGERTELAFVADTTTSVVRAVDPAAAPGPHLTALFSNPWWSPALAPAADTP